MNQFNNPKLTTNAKSLRKNMTKEERHLWYDFLKDLPLTVHRQKVLGHYIVDFYVADAKIVVELDGSQHYQIEGVEKDVERDTYLQSLGMTILRYANSDVNQNFRGVCQDICNHLGCFNE